MPARSLTLTCFITMLGASIADAQSFRTSPSAQPANQSLDAGSAHPPQHKVVKSDAEWARLLTRDQFLVTRRKETEQAFTGKLLHNKAKGYYLCVCCGSPLFTSRAKFDSGTGWPSFFAPIRPGSVANEVDSSYGQIRVEVICANCDAHLGHVFDDGPAPTGLRYCMNSLALKFVKQLPKDEEPPKNPEVKPTEGTSSDTTAVPGDKP